MNRKDFLKIAGFGIGMTTLAAFKNITDNLVFSEEKMPVFFIGHGSPMNAIEQNEFSEKWKSIGENLPKPKAILCISAHWLTSGSFVTAATMPKIIYDFYGFPPALYSKKYPAMGNEVLSNEICKAFTGNQVNPDYNYGLDHGTWSILAQMYPLADVPVIQLSIDIRKNEQYHYELAKYLKYLPEKGILVIGSGNIIHNLSMISWDHLNTEFAFDWATEINTSVIKNIENRNIQALINLPGSSNSSQLSIPTNDHYLPLLYALGIDENSKNIEFFNNKIIAGSLSMTSLKIS